MTFKRGVRGFLRSPFRNYIFNKIFHAENLVKKCNVTLGYDTCKEVVIHANKLIADCIRVDIDGFKLPLGMGYLATTKYKPTNTHVNWSESIKLGKRVYHHNIHSDGWACKISWFRVGRVTNMRASEVYKFSADTYLSQSVSKSFKEGYPYNNWVIADFISKGRLENLYNKRYRKNLFKEQEDE